MTSTWMRPLAVFFLLLLDSAYLVALNNQPSLAFFAAVVLHLLLGLALGALGLRALRQAWAGLEPLPRLAALLLGLGTALGLVLMVTGATRPFRPILYAHIGLAGMGALLLLVHLARAACFPRARLLVGATVAVLLASASLRAADERARPQRERIQNPALAPATMDGEGAGPTSPFFPSSAETNVGGTIPSNFFMTSASCGRCHEDIYDQWNASVHHFSSFNNQWYRKSIEYMQDVVGTRPSKWCAGCHDHAVFFNGRFDRPIKEQIDTPEAQAGLACTSCHSIVHVKSTMGQGDFTIEYPPLHDLAASEQPLLRLMHDYLLRLAPGPHRKTFLKDFHREQAPEFCSSCHKVHLDLPVNQYRWFRGFNEYDNWQASGISGEGARSFYAPPRPQKCTDCHMPLVPSDDPAAKRGLVRSHRFPGANTAIPFVNQDHEQLRVTQEFLRARQVTLDVFGLIRGEPQSTPTPQAAASEPRLSSTFAQGEESLSFGATQSVHSAPVDVIGPLGALTPKVRRGESLRVEVVVRTRGVGHFFPGGTVDAFDVWVELQAVDERGRTLLHSGEVEQGGRGPVEPGAHFYRSLMLDEHGNPINKRNAFMARSVAYVRLIPPGAADTVHYRLLVPEDCGERITLKARLNYRKFSWWNTQWAFAGVRDPAQPNLSVGPGHDDGRWLFTGDMSRVSGKLKAIPEIPITVMAESEAVLDVVPRGTTLPPDEPLLQEALRERWNDYGIGLLLQGDIKAAEAVFLKVTQMDPEYADGWVNVARARLTEGNLAGAQEFLKEALRRAPGLAKAHFFMGTVLKGLGRYDEALSELEQASRLFPRDRVVLNQTGRTLFLKRRYAEAVAAFERVLQVDPEDLQAHYNLMLCYQGLGRPELAQRHQALYERFKADESAQAITGPYRQLHPHDNNERQAVHEHARELPGSGGSYRSAGGGGAR